LFSVAPNVENEVCGVSFRHPRLISGGGRLDWWSKLFYCTNSSASVEEREIDELEDPEMWDFDQMQIHPAVPDSHAIAPVRFSHRDFQIVAAAAARSGNTLFEYIRIAALEKAQKDVSCESEGDSTHL
jgi:hypothetical protein